MSSSSVKRNFILPKNCQVQITTSQFLPLRSVKLVRSVDDEDYVIESVNFRLAEWKEFLEAVPVFLQLMKALKKNKNLDFPSLDEVLNTSHPELLVKGTWEFVEYQSHRLVAKLIPYKSLIGTREVLLCIRGYKTDVWGRIHPSAFGLDLFQAEVDNLNDHRKEITDNISYLEKTCPPISSKNLFAGSAFQH